MLHIVFIAKFSFSAKKADDFHFSEQENRWLKKSVV